MNDQGQQGSPSTSSSSSSSSITSMSINNNTNSTNSNNLLMNNTNNNHVISRRGGLEPNIPLQYQNAMPPSYGYNPRGINTVGVELQLSNIDREIRGLQQQQEQLDQLNCVGGGRSLTPDGLPNSTRSLFTPAQLHQFKDQIRRYRMFLMWNQAATTPPPSTPSPTITPPIVAPPLEPRLPARGRGSRGPRGSRGQPRTRTNRPRAPKIPTASNPAPQLPPPYIRYPTPYVRYPRGMRPQSPHTHQNQYARLPMTPFVQGDMIEGLNDVMMNQEQDDGLIRSIGSSHCSFCASYVAEGAGISLQSCLHTFCRPCLVGFIEQSDAPQIPCPIQQESNCGGYLLDPEVKALISPDAYQNYISRSLVLAIKSDNSLSQCFVNDCPGVCVVEDGLKSFYCPVCNKLNCLNCETTHDSPCEASKKRANENDASYSYDIAMKRSRAETVGEAELRKDFETNWEQMCAKFNSESDNCNTNSSDPATGDPNDLTSSNYLQKNNTIINHLEKSDLTTAGDFECPICLIDVGTDEGVMLRECLHRFCRTCLASTIEHCEHAEVKCPYQSATYSCPLNLSAREIKALVSKEVFDRYLSRSVIAAEMTIPNTFHCKSVNCEGWCEVEGGVPFFVCPVCEKRNCIPCKAIHEAISCSEYQGRLRQGECDGASQETLNKLISNGKAMRCPTCKVVIIKNGGCDGLTCQICRTMICWATKGPRWGPKGPGDKSGGCHCGEFGKACAPTCSFCH